MTMEDAVCAQSEQFETARGGDALLRPWSPE